MLHPVASPSRWSITMLSAPMGASSAPGSTRAGTPYKRVAPLTTCTCGIDDSYAYGIGPSDTAPAVLGVLPSVVKSSGGLWWGHPCSCRQWLCLGWMRGGGGEGVIGRAADWQMIKVVKGWLLPSRNHLLRSGTRTGETGAAKPRPTRTRRAPAKRLWDGPTWAGAPLTRAWWGWPRWHSCGNYDGRWVGRNQRNPK
jgi:hypothetical protein